MRVSSLAQADGTIIGGDQAVRIGRGKTVNEERKEKRKSPEERSEARIQRRLARSQEAAAIREQRRARLEEAAAAGAYRCRDVPGYDLELRPPHRDLVVMFSPGQQFALYKRDLERDVLFVADRLHEYYLGDAIELAQAILGAVKSNSYQCVVFSGFSKGGLGALSISRICAMLAPERVFHAVAFSPQVRLYPRNDNLYFWSYGVFCDASENRPDLADAMERFGDVSRIGGLPNLCSTIVYARQSKADNAEAMRITGPNATLRTVEGVFHGTSIYFLSKGIGRKKLIDRITKMYANADDHDLQQTRPEDIGEMADAILASVNEQPTLNELFGEVIERRPVVSVMSPELEAFAAHVRALVALEPATDAGTPALEPPRAAWSAFVFGRRQA